MCKEKFLVKGFREFFKYEWMRYFGVNFFSIVFWQCFSSILAVCEVWKQTDKEIIGRGRRILYFKGIGEILIYIFFIVIKFQYCNYVNNFN